jgi:hypothetical protein
MTHWAMMSPGVPGSFEAVTLKRSRLVFSVDIIPAMTLRSGVYIVPTNRWYIERTVWLIAGVVLLASTAMALLVNPLWILGVTATGLVSINVAFTGFCPVGSVLSLLGFTPMLGSDKFGSNTSVRRHLYFMQTDKWYLERRIYLAVGINISVASALVLAYSPWVTLFTIFVGGAMVWFAATGFCVMANGLYWLGAEPRLAPETMPSGRCEECAMSGMCLGGHSIRARREEAPSIEPKASPLIKAAYSMPTLP